MNDTNNLTKALMDKMTKDISKPDEKGCTLEDRLNNGFTLSLDNFEVEGLVPECKPAPAPAEKPKEGSGSGCNSSPATITITKADTCEKKPAAVTTPAPTPAPAPAPTAAKTAPTPSEKTADKTDAIKKLEAAKSK